MRQAPAARRGVAADEVRPCEKPKVMIFGAGPNRIGQGIEFDYCCVHACYELAERGFETIMVNCNPETVSTDYDTSDRLYFAGHLRRRDGHCGCRAPRGRDHHAGR